MAVLTYDNNMIKVTATYNCSFCILWIFSVSVHVLCYNVSISCFCVLCIRYNSCDYSCSMSVLDRIFSCCWKRQMSAWHLCIEYRWRSMSPWQGWHWADMWLWPELWKVVGYYAQSYCSLGSDTRHSGEVIGGEGCCVLAPDWSTS